MKDLHMKNSFKHWSSKVNGWVFLSHPSKDYEQVKIIRDYLELNNFNAIMFYLHSFNDTSKEKQVQDLILNEIDARNIFVSCNSHNADTSKWVKIEKNHVRYKKNIIKVDIDLRELKSKRCSELSKLDDLMIQSSIYILAPSNEKRIQETINFLSGRGFKIYEANEIKYAKGQKRLEIFQNAVSETIEANATLIVFVHDNVKWQAEVNKMMNKYDAYQKNIILIYMNTPTLDEKNIQFHNRYMNEHTIQMYEYREDFDRYLLVLEERIWGNIDG